MKIFFSCTSGSQVKTCRELLYPHVLSIPDASLIMAAEYLQKLRHPQARHEGQTIFKQEAA